MVSEHNELFISSTEVQLGTIIVGKIVNTLVNKSNNQKLSQYSWMIIAFQQYSRTTFVEKIIHT